VFKDIKRTTRKICPKLDLKIEHKKVDPELTLNDFLHHFGPPTKNFGKYIMGFCMHGLHY
jgi:hypothetical protein